MREASRSAAALDQSSARGRGSYQIRIDGDGRLLAAAQQAPARLNWTQAAAGDPPLAVLGWLAGGMTGGDRLDGSVLVDRGGRLTLISQAAEKIYRSLAEPARIEQRFHVSDGGLFEFLPSECILFDAANLERRQVIDAQPDARFLVGDLTVFGRQAHGESFQQGRLWDRWQVRIDGHTRFVEDLLLDDRSRQQLNAPFGFAGRSYSGLLLYRGPCTAPILSAIRAQDGDPCLVGASLCDELLLVRLLARGSIALRRAFEAIWSLLRQQLGFTAPLPRLWYL